MGHMKHSSQHPHSLNRVLMLVLIFIVSMSAGFLGGLLSPREDGPLTLEDINIRPIILEDRTKTRSSQSDAQDSVTSIRPSIVSVYTAIRGEELKKPYERMYTNDLFKAYALAVTADGWIIAPQAIRALTRVQDLRVIDQNRQVYGVEKKIDDPALPISYLKIQASNLKPIQFTSLETMSPGATATIFQNTRSVKSIVLSGPEYKNPKTAKEVFAHTDRLEKIFNTHQTYDIQGLPVVSQDRGVIGFTSDEGIIPLAYAKDAFLQVLRTGVPARHALKLTYLDIAWLPSLPESLKDGILISGALLVSEKKSISIASGDETVTLLPGDIVIAVNDESVSEQRSLSELLAHYKTGDSVRLKIRRDGTDSEQTITLP